MTGYVPAGAWWTDRVVRAQEDQDQRSAQGAGASGPLPEPRLLLGVQGIYSAQHYRNIKYISIKKLCWIFFNTEINEILTHILN